MQEIFVETSTEASPQRIEEVKVASPPGLRKRPVYVNNFADLNGMSCAYSQVPSRKIQTELKDFLCV